MLERRVRANFLPYESLDAQLSKGVYIRPPIEVRRIPKGGRELARHARMTELWALSGELLTAVPQRKREIMSEIITRWPKGKKILLSIISDESRDISRRKARR